MSEPHRHDWRHTDTPGAEWTCAECTETCATCGTCGGPSGTSLLLCQVCERKAARVLTDIADALSHYQRSPRSLVSSPGDMRLIPGGTGGSGHDDPAAVMDILWGWVARWSEHAGATGEGAVDYLRGHHLWAAHNAEVSDWPGYLRAMRTARHAARRIAGLLPQRMPEPCVHCGGECVQDWSDDAWQPLSTGLSDVVRCLGCGLTWDDRAHWHFATRRRIVELPADHPDALITMEHARQIWPDVPSGTLRQWAKRWRDDGPDMLERVWLWWAAYSAWRAGERPWWAPEDRHGPGEAPSLPGWLPERGRDGDAPLYRVGDLQVLVDRWADTDRSGRRRAGQSA